nr:hypothetical protein [Ruegeria lacuscaerulensis]
MGARVIAAVSSQAKAEFCRSIGVEETIKKPWGLDKALQKVFSREIKVLEGPSGALMLL